jgi:hypothetical protein
MKKTFTVRFVVAWQLCTKWGYGSRYYASLVRVTMGSARRLGLFKGGTVPEKVWSTTLKCIMGFSTHFSNAWTSLFRVKKVLIMGARARTVRILFSALVCLERLRRASHAFVWKRQNSRRLEAGRERQLASNRIRPALASVDHGREVHVSTALEEEASRLRAEAERIRLEAEHMDMRLTLDKIRSMENKLSNPGWYRRQDAEQQAALELQLQSLQAKLNASNTTTNSSSTTATRITSGKRVERPRSRPSTFTTALTPSPHTPCQREVIEPIPANPLNGFEAEDLELYLPVALDVERTMPNASLSEQVVAFQRRPELQEHFQRKIQEVILDPIQELQRMRDLRSRYLDSTSDVERSQLKRDMERLDRLSSSLEDRLVYSDTIYLSLLAPLSDEELGQRKAAISELPHLLQELYRRRCGVTEQDDDPRENGEQESNELAILLEYYEPQLDLLEQVQMLKPLSAEQRLDVKRALRSLPPPVRRFLAVQELGIDGEEYREDPDETEFEVLIEALENGGSSLNGLLNFESDSFEDEIVWNPSDSAKSARYFNDIDFVDRSRYVTEFYPTVAAMESNHPATQLAEDFCTQVLDSRRTFMVRTKPERVAGGYFIRGENLIPEDESTGHKLVELIRSKLDEDSNSYLKEKLEFFHIPDPAPLSDEQVELGAGDQPLILLTTNSPGDLYPESSPMVKIAISGLGLCSIAIFAGIVCSLQPATQERVIAAYNSGNMDAMPWFWVNTATVLGSSLAIVFIHECAHRVVSWIDKARNAIST